MLHGSAISEIIVLNKLSVNVYCKLLIAAAQCRPDKERFGARIRFHILVDDGGLL
jgi:hypothetical protein